MENKAAVALLALALVASVGLNVYLWIDGPSGRSSEAAATSRPGSPSAPPPLDVPEGSDVIIGSLEEGPECAPALALCREKSAELEREVAERREPHEAFEKGETDPELEARVAPELARLLEGQDYTLECRSGTCQLEVLLPDDADADGNEWMLPMQEDAAFRKLFRKWTFAPDRPTTDPVSGEGLMVMPMFLTAADPDAVPATDVLRPLIDQLEESGAIEHCAKEHPDDRGTLHYRLRIIPDERRIGADMGGDLYATDAGRCIASAQVRIAAKATVPEKVSGGAVYHHITLPLE